MPINSLNRPASWRRATTRLTMLPTACPEDFRQPAHRRPVRHLRQVRPQLFERRREPARTRRPRHPLDPSPAVAARHPPRRIPQLHRGSLHGRWRHPRTGCRSYRGTFRPQLPQRNGHHDDTTNTVNAPVTESCSCLTNICVTPETRLGTVMTRTGLSSSLLVVVQTNETRKPLPSATSAGTADGPTVPPKSAGIRLTGRLSCNAEAGD